MAFGQGRWEDPDEAWRMAHLLGGRGVPNRVDVWGPTYDHDWATWRQMLPVYLDQLIS
jgi:esterase/lipase superfamily enzyme